MSEFVDSLRRYQRAMIRAQKQIALLDAMNYDERDSVLDELRDNARDATTLDIMSDDSIAFDSAMRDYHAR